MKHRIPYTLTILLLSLALIGCNIASGLWSSPTPIPTTPTPSATHTLTDTPTLTPTDTASPSATPSPTNTDTPTQTVAPTVTLTPSATATITVTPTADDPTPTREVGYVTPTPERLTLTQATYFYACASTTCTRYLFPVGTVYEVWDSVTNDSWWGIAIPITDYLYTTFWMQAVIPRQ